MNWQKVGRVLGVILVTSAIGCAREEEPTETTPARLSAPVTSGPCSFSSPPPPGTPTNRTFTIKVPTGTSREEFAIATAGGALTIGSAALVVKDPSGYASVSSVEATNRLLLGPAAKAHNALSELTGIELGTAAHLYGYAKTASTVIRQTASIVDGVTTQNANLKPLVTTSWIVPYPANTRGNCTLPATQTQIIDPGSYGTVAVGIGAHLKLRTGTYYFRGLSLGLASFLDVDNSVGPVYVYVRDTFSFSGIVVPASASQPNVLVGYSATAGVTLQGSFWGVLVAPDAAVTVGTATSHTGSFFSKSLTMQAAATIRHRAFGSTTFCPGADSCSVLCPCAQGGACQSNAECQAGLSCTSGTCQPPVMDDGNPCTADSIGANGTIVHMPLPAGTSCSDSDQCDGQEVCNATGECLGGAPPALDDGNPCTTDACTPADGITHVPVATGTSCSDANVCDGAEACDGAGGCAVGTPPAIDDGNPCTADACDSLIGVTHTPLPSGTSCADSNVCNGAETCNGTGECIGGVAPSIDDQNACTEDTCDASAGIRHAPVPSGTSCADADLCNGPESCDSQGECIAGTPSEVDDGNPCTLDTCHPTNGASHLPVAEGTTCDDGSLCNGTDTCDGLGACQVGTPPAVDDGNPCTADACDSVLGVTHSPVAPGTNCADATVCNGTETCNATGSCTPGSAPTVDDGNPCTADTCDPATGVTHTPVSAGTSCPDGDACNGSEVCNSSGACTAGTLPVTDDGNPCTADSCDPASGVSHTPVAAGTSCADANLCNGEETCNSGGTCLPGTPLETDDGNPCTADSCVPAEGVQHIPVSAGTSCVDANVCNGAESCDGIGACSPGTPLATDDANPCTADACEPVTGVSHTPVAAGTACADANVCNGTEECNGSGACTAGTPPTLDDNNPCTADSCDPSTGIAHTPVSAGTSCADPNQCNGSEVCDGSGICAAGVPPATDDGNPCTVDACNPGTGVTHSPAPSGTNCADANPCNGAEICDANSACTSGTPPTLDDGNPCTADSCDPVNGVVHAPAPSGSACDDGNHCNGLEACNGFGQCASTGVSAVDDFNPCTLDTCDSSSGIQHTPLAAGISCADDDLCNGEERCDALGACKAGAALDIDDNDACTIDECDPVGGAMHTEIQGCGGAAPGEQFEARVSIMGRVIRVDGSAVTNFTVSVFNDTLDTLPRADTATTVNSDGKFRVRLLSFPRSTPARMPAQHVLIKLESADFPPVYRSADVRPSDVVSLGDIVVLQRDPNVTVVGPEGGTAEDSQATLQLVIPSGALSEPTPIRITPIRTRAEFPLPLPHNTVTTYGMELEPSGTTLAVPATLRIKNTLSIPTNMRIPVGTMDPRFGDWKPEGQAVWDGTRFAMQVEHFSPHDANFAVVGELVTFIDQARDPNKAKDKDCGIGSSASYANGSLQQSFALPMHVASGHDYTLALNYDSGQSGSVAFGTAAASAVPTSEGLSGIVRSPVGMNVRVECAPPGSAAANGCGGGGSPCVVGGQIGADFGVLQRSRLFDQDASNSTILGRGTNQYEFDFNYLLPNDPNGLPVRSGYFPNSITSSITVGGGARACVAGGAGFGVAAPAPNPGGGQAPGSSARLPLEQGSVVDFPEYQLVVHRRSSPLGSGWALADFGRLYRTPDRMSADIMWGNGQRETFRPYPQVSRVVNMNNAGTGALTIDRQTGEVFAAWTSNIVLLDPATGARTTVAPNPAAPRQNLAITYVNGERVFLIESPNRLYESRADGSSRELLTLVTGPSGLRPGLAAVGHFAYVTSDKLSSGADAQVVRRVDLAHPDRPVVNITSAGGGDLSLDPRGEVKAQDFWFMHPRGLAPAFDGGLYVSDDRRHAVYHLAPDENGEVGPNSLVTRVLGSGLDTLTVGLGRKLPALQMAIRGPEMLNAGIDGKVYVTSAAVGGVLAFDPIEQSAHWLAFDRNSLQRNVDVDLQSRSLAPLGNSRLLAPTNDSIYLVEAPFTSEFEPTRSITFTQSGATVVDTSADTIEQYEWITPAQNEARLSNETLRSGELIRSIAYQDADRIEYIEDASGGQIRFEYDALGHLRRVTDAADRSTEFDIDGDGNLRELLYPTGETLRFDYENFRLTRVTHPDSEASSYSYAPDGTLASATRPGGGTTQLQSAMSGGAKYDAAGKLVYEAKLTDDRGVQHAIQVDAAGAVISDKFTANGQMYDVQNVYAPQLVGNSLFEHTSNRLLRIAGTTVNGVNVTPLAQFNPAGQLINLKRSSDSAATNVVAPKYDAAQRLSRIDWAINFVNWGYTYDAAGHLTKVADQFTNGADTGRRTIFNGFRASDGQPTSVTQHGITSTLGYDEFGLVSSSADTAGRTLTVTNDAAGDARIVNDGTTTVRFEYDEGSRLTSITDAENNVTEFDYRTAACACSNGDRVTAIKTPDLAIGQQWSFDYSSDGDLEGATTPLGEREQIFHNPQRDVIATVDRKNRSTTFTYDQLGRQSTITDALGRIGSFAYSVPTSGSWAGPTLYAQSATDTPAPTSLSAALADGQFQIGTNLHQPYDSRSRAELYRDATFQFAFWNTADLLNRPWRIGDRSDFPIDSLSPGSSGVPITEVLFTYENNLSTETNSSPFPLLQGLTSRDAQDQSIGWSGKLRRNSDLDIQSVDRVLGRVPTSVARARILRIDITRDTAGRMTRVDTLVDAPGGGGAASAVIGYKQNGVQVDTLTLSTPTTTQVETGQCGCDHNCPSRECTTNSSNCVPGGRCRTYVTAVDTLAQSFQYDARGLPSARTVNVHPAASVPSFSAGDFSYEYDAVGRNTVVNYPGGHLRTQSFDALGRLTSRCYDYADGSPQHCYTAQYDAIGNPVLLTDPDMRREIDYDDLDRVLEVRRFVPATATTPTHVESYAYNALGGFSVYDGVVMDDRRPRLDGAGTASAGISASLNGDSVTLDAGGRVSSFNGQTFQYFKADHRLKAILTASRNKLFVYDTLGRLLQTHSQAPGVDGSAPGAVAELLYYNGTDDSIAAEAKSTVLSPTPSTEPRERPPEPVTAFQIIYDGIDQPLWVVSSNETAIYELDTTGNVRHLHAGQRFSEENPDGNDPEYTGDLGGYAYSAFGKRLPASDVGGLAPPGFSQPFTWQGKRGLGGNLYYSRARIWSADLGVFLQPDQYAYLSRGGTLWSWPGQNPFRWADPSGRALSSRFDEGSRFLGDAAGWLASNAMNEWGQGNYGVAALDFGAALATGVASVFASPAMDLVGFGTVGGGIRAGTAAAARECSTAVARGAPQLATRGQNLLQQARDPRLRDAVENLFRKNARVGDGSTMAAVRHERATGQLLSPKGHTQKLINRREQLQKLWRDPSLSASDRQIARELLGDIQDSLGGP
jgi:RHS repeat-associated protein